MADHLLEEAISLWQRTPKEAPPLGRVFTIGEQAAREAELDRFLDAIQAELQKVPATRAERTAAREHITSAFVHFAKAGIDLEDRHLDLLLSGGFSAIGTELGRQARRFDPRVSTADILQASRNAWTACALRMLLGRKMALTPAIFAYSMLYPYSDNFMDDPRISSEEKLTSSRRFRRRLAGEPVDAVGGTEAAIWNLVGLIESEYPRAEFPGVYGSLLGIHQAQEHSLQLLRGGSVDVLRLSFEKGGTSVLADGYLAAGSLTAEQASFVFDWGVLLQLADDLQDVEQDAHDGVLTLFSQAAGHEKLDVLTNRTLRFGNSVMLRMQMLPAPGCRELKELIARSGASLLIRSAGEAASLYSREYLAELETHSPFRFAFLSERRRRLAKRSALLSRLFEAFLAGEQDEPAFPLLPSSLMPRF